MSFNWTTKAAPETLIVFFGQGSTFFAKKVLSKRGEEAGTYLIEVGEDSQPLHVGRYVCEDLANQNSDKLLQNIKTAKLIIMSFSMQDQNSFFDVMDKWHPVLNNKPISTALLLVGVHNNPNKPLEVKFTQGRALSTILECEFHEFSETNQNEIIQLVTTSLISVPATLTRSISSKSANKSGDRSVLSGTLLRRKRSKLKLEWCEKGKLSKLQELAKEKKFNFHCIEYTNKSPFAAALLAGNLEAAEFFLQQEKGCADLSGLFLTTLPQALIHWNSSTIKDLNLSNNRLNCIPISFRTIEKVHTIGNPLLCLPENLRKGKWPKIQEYLHSVSSGKVSWNVRKVIILGEEAAGKDNTNTMPLKQEQQS